MTGNSEGKKNSGVISKLFEKTQSFLQSLDWLSNMTINIEITWSQPM
jgi:hypothetical protein